MTTIVLHLVRLYLLTLSRLAPRMAGRHAYRLFSTPRKRADVPRQVERVMASATTFHVDTNDARVAGYRWPATRPGQATRVLLVHGWESRAARLAVWVEPLLDAGFEVVAFDAPAHGASTGRRTNPMQFADAILAVKHRVGPIDACVGHSLGAYSSMLAATRDLLGSREVLPIRALVAVAGAESGVDAMAMFCDALGLGPRFLPRLLEAAAEVAGRPVSDFDAAPLLARRRIETLLLHDPEDTDVPFRAARRIADACPHASLEPVDGLGHHRIARDPAILARGVGFLVGHAARTAA